MCIPTPGIMNLFLNGHSIVSASSELLDVLINNGYPNLDGCAVAVNDSVIPKSVLSETQLQTDDKILIITATQGG